ncbi:hypothetical protein CO251_04560 [Sulfobacillus sp. hq2]|uniref:hypothetical protein n=1 Tax=Sulfobacillus thermotolerans TaxID=338644 RepID=UPI000CD10A59|nr:hypothetical protein CO251_04560 [Sulfobacillus sp. hq2]
MPISTVSIGVEADTEDATGTALEGEEPDETEEVPEALGDGDGDAEDGLEDDGKDGNDGMEEDGRRAGVGRE